MAFGEFNIAISGLFASQRALAVINNNVTNINTPGYSRQILTQKAVQAMPLGKIGMLGQGVETTGIYRVRDKALDQKLWEQNDIFGEYEVKVAQSDLIEGIFGEPTDEGFTKVYNDLFNAIDNLSKDPSAGEKKSSLSEIMKSFTDYYYKSSQSLIDAQSDLNFQVKTTVEEVNMYANRIKSLNEQIFLQELNGAGEASILRDERDLCVDKLSKLANIEAEEVTVFNSDGKETKQFRVGLNGQNLVDHTDVRLLELEPRDTKVNERDTEGLYDIIWNDGTPFDMYSPTLSGELQGLLDMRDGVGGKVIMEEVTMPDGSVVDVRKEVSGYNGVPYYIDRLDEFVRDLAKGMNDIYSKDAAGNVIDADGNNLADYAFFSYKDTNGNIIASNDPSFDYTKLNAGNFSISKEIEENSDNIRTNYDHDPNANKNPDEANNNLLMDLFSQKDNMDFFKQGTPSDYMISVFSGLGINASSAKMYYTTQKTVTKIIEEQRMSNSEVDSNEEFMNLIRYNQAYQISAKVMNTIDEIYNTTINGLGNF